MKYKITSIEQTCGACPAQWEGKTDDDRAVYIRYRYGYLSITIDQNKILGKQLGDGLDGCLSFEDLVRETAEIIEWNV